MKKALIVIELVDESGVVANNNIENEILRELENMPFTIPWMRKVEKVTILEVDE